MSQAASAIVVIRNLLSVGEATCAAPSHLSRVGLCLSDGADARCVATAAMVGVASALPNEKEAVAAAFACDPGIRQLWLAVIAARLKEAGRRRDADELTRAIDQLGAASKTILRLLPTGSLQPTGKQLLETELLGAPADQAVAWPILLRIIGATANLIEGGQGQPAKPLPSMVMLDPSRCWRRDRILQLPRLGGDTQEELQFVLSGYCGPLSDQESVPEDVPSQALMRWVLYRPWVLLLAQLTFMQEAWLAEQISGRLALELSDDQMANPYQPSRVNVVITTPEGDEVLCGSVGDLLFRVLERLGVTLLARPEEVRQLDELLAPVIRLVLEQKVWRFEPLGASGGRPGFVIDDDFSTSCYRAFGSKYFYRGGSVLTSAIRLTCEQWAREKLNEAGSSRPAAIEIYSPSDKGPAKSRTTLSTWQREEQP
jgi:hypothetical protein